MPSPYLLPVIRAGSSCVHAHQAVLRTAKGMVVMALCLRVGTESSGMELVPYALNQIGVRGNFQMLFACEKDRLCGKLIRHCHRKATKPIMDFKDLRKRQAATLPDHDLYIAGLPCQPFSSMSIRDGSARRPRVGGKYLFAS